LIDWSYDILPKEECMLLRRLSVFAGGWVFEAAESICSDLDVLTLLSQLVNKSLVTVDEEGDEPFQVRHVVARQRYTVAGLGTPCRA
jgi:predicted ATPase